MAGRSPGACAAAVAVAAEAAKKPLRVNASLTGNSPFMSSSFYSGWRSGGGDERAENVLHFRGGLVADLDLIAQRDHLEQFFNVGIAHAHMISHVTST